MGRARSARAADARRAAVRARRACARRPTGVRQARATLREHGLLPDRSEPSRLAGRRGEHRRQPAPRPVAGGARRRPPSPAALRLRGLWHELPRRPRDPARGRARACARRARRADGAQRRGQVHAAASRRRAARAHARPRGAPGRVALLLQNPGDYFIHERVGEEAPAQALAQVGLAERRAAQPARPLRRRAPAARARDRDRRRAAGRARARRAHARHGPRRQGRARRGSCARRAERGPGRDRGHARPRVRRRLRRARGAARRRSRDRRRHDRRAARRWLVLRDRDRAHPRRRRRRAAARAGRGAAAQREGRRDDAPAAPGGASRRRSSRELAARVVLARRARARRRAGSPTSAGARPRAPPPSSPCSRPSPRSAATRSRRCPTSSRSPRSRSSSGYALGPLPGFTVGALGDARLQLHARPGPLHALADGRLGDGRPGRRGRRPARARAPRPRPARAVLRSARARREGGDERLHVDARRRATRRLPSCSWRDRRSPTTSPTWSRASSSGSPSRRSSPACWRGRACACRSYGSRSRPPTETSVPMRGLPRGRAAGARVLARGNRSPSPRCRPARRCRPAARRRRVRRSRGRSPTSRARRTPTAASAAPAARRAPSSTPRGPRSGSPRPDATRWRCAGAGTRCSTRSAAKRARCTGAGDLERTILALRACGASPRSLPGGRPGCQAPARAGRRRLLRPPRQPHRLRCPRASRRRLRRGRLLRRRSGPLAAPPAEPRRRVRLRSARRSQRHRRHGGGAAGRSRPPGRAAGHRRARPSPSCAATRTATAASPSSPKAPPMPSRRRGRCRAWLPPGRDAGAVTRAGSRSPVAYLRSLVAPDGSVRYSRTGAQTPVWVTSQALTGLAERPLPVSPVAARTPRRGAARPRARVSRMRSSPPRSACSKAPCTR